LAAALNLRWTPIAAEDLQSAWEYVAIENEAAAHQLVEHIATAVEQLQQHPTLGRPGRVPGTRELVVVGTPYVVSYREIQREIQVLAVLHGARKWPENF
jgi:toxin ParE1/3/4